MYYSVLEVCKKFEFRHQCVLLCLINETENVRETDCEEIQLIFILNGNTIFIMFSIYSCEIQDSQ